MRNHTWAYLLRRLHLFSVPFWIILISYFYFDPFKVIYHYNDFNEDNIVITNRDVISTRMFLNNNEKYRYRSFLLGNSRTLGFPMKDWSPYIQDSTPFKFDASNESLFGIWSKLRFLDIQCDSIKNVLIVCDRGLFRGIKDSKQPLFIKDYKVSGNSIYFFHFSFLKAYIADLFFLKYLDYKLFHKYRRYMSGALDNRKISVLPVTNDLLFEDLEAAIQTNPDQYYQKHQAVFYKRDTVKVEGHPELYEKHIEMLKEMKDIFDKHKTNCKFIISPLYDQLYFNKKDRDTLERIFGIENVYDFSGINRYTMDYNNYYEASHYRIKVGIELLREVYSANRLTTAN